jgi:hypothetical protein
MLNAKPINARRTGKHEMLKAERAKLSRLLIAFLESHGAVPRISGNHGQFFDGHDLETTVGTLRVQALSDFIACRFAEPGRASLWYYGRDDLHPCQSHGRLNPYSGKFNFHFGRTTAAEVMAEFTRAIQGILPSTPADVFSEDR